MSPSTLSTLSTVSTVSTLSTPAPSWSSLTLPPAPRRAGLLVARPGASRARQCAQGGFNGRMVQMGIGLHTGPLVMGNLGNERQVEFTIDDEVGAAAR